MSQYIDVTPSWEATARMLVVLMERGTAEGKAEAEKEILRMGRIIDKLLEEKKAINA